MSRHDMPRVDRGAASRRSSGRGRDWRNRRIWITARRGGSRCRGRGSSRSRRGRHRWSRRCRLARGRLGCHPDRRRNGVKSWGRCRLWPGLSGGGRRSRGNRSATWLGCRRSGRGSWRAWPLAWCGRRSARTEIAGWPGSKRNWTVGGRGHRRRLRCGRRGDRAT